MLQWITLTTAKRCYAASTVHGTSEVGWVMVTCPASLVVYSIIESSQLSRPASTCTLQGSRASNLSGRVTASCCHLRHTYSTVHVLEPPRVLGQNEKPHYTQVHNIRNACCSHERTDTQTNGHWQSKAIPALLATRCAAKCFSSRKDAGGRHVREFLRFEI